MEIVAVPSCRDFKIYPSSVVIKREPFIDCLEDGTAIHLQPPHYRHTDSMMRDEGSAAPGLHGVVDESQRYLQLTDIPIKQEHQEVDWKYPTPWSTTIHENVLLTDDRMKLVTTGTEMSTTMATLKVEGVQCEEDDAHSTSHIRGIPKPPVPVTLYGHHADGVTIAKAEHGYCGNPMMARNESLGMHINMTQTSADGEPYWKFGRISNASLYTDMGNPDTGEIFKCGNKFSSNSQLVEEGNRHMSMHTSGKPVECSTFDYLTTTKGSLARHMTGHIAGKLSRCSLCGYIYNCNGRATILNHMRTHTGEKPFKCPLCDYRSASEGNLKAHMVTHSSEKPFKCSLCGYRCAAKRYLNRHMVIHSGKKPYKCSLCDYRSPRKSNLNSHMAGHGEKPFECSLCEYRAFKKSSLNAHLVRHTGEKPFKCSLCDYKSGTKDQVNKHMVTHTGEKPFKCSLCAYRSATNRNLNKHLVTHAAEKPFKCSICDYRSVRKDSLKRHLITQGHMP